MKENLKNTILLVLIGVAIGVAGIIAYYQQITWLFYTCTVLCMVQMLLNIFLGMLQDHTYPYLAACLLVGYYLTGDIPNGLCYGVCLHYATALICLGFYALPIVQMLVFIVLPVTSITAYFLHAEHLFMVIAVFCTLHFIINHLRGKNPPPAMDIFLWCVAFGVGFLQLRDTDAYQSVKFIKGILWGGSAYYIVALLYGWYRVYIKHERFQKND